MQTYPRIDLVQITGGEPMLQSDIYELFYELRKFDKTILLETNGSINLSKLPDSVVKIIDVKTPGSGFGDCFLMSNLSCFCSKKDNLKFVLTNIEDYNWTVQFLQENDLYGSNILLSCDSNKINPKIIAERILHDGLNVRLQVQLHKILDLR
jgi:7-carboxy-7-deazaguanine synthase